MGRVGLALLAGGLWCAGAALASAADLPAAPAMKAPSPVAAAYDWSGFYIGAHLAGGSGIKRWTDTTTTPLDEGTTDISGVIAGGQVGYNVQTGRFLFGIEAQGSWTNVHGDMVSIAFPANRDASRIDSIATITARIGYTWDNILLYVKGGGAFARDKFSITDIPSGVNYANFTQHRWGIVAGGGIEYGFTRHVSTFIEFNYLDFGTVRSTNVLCVPNAFGCVGPGGSFNKDIYQHVEVLKGGINFRFGSAPVVARY